MLFACLILMQRSFVIDAFNANLPNQGKLNGGITLKKSWCNLIKGNGWIICLQSFIDDYKMLKKIYL